MLLAGYQAATVLCFLFLPKRMPLAAEVLITCLLLAIQVNFHFHLQTLIALQKNNYL